MARPVIALEEGWEIIDRDGIQRVVALVRDMRGGRPFTSAEYARVYDTVFRMCSQMAPHNHSQQLYTRYQESMNAYLTEEVAPLTIMPQDERLLAEVVARWTRFSLVTKWMGHLFGFLNQWVAAQRTYHRVLPTVTEAGVSAFRAAVYDRLKASVAAAIVGIVDRERNGEVVDLPLLRGATSWMLAMDANASRMAVLAQPAGAPLPSTSLAVIASAVVTSAAPDAGPLYVADLEAPYLAATRAYYSARITEWLAVDNVPAYLARCERVLESEQARCAAFLRPSTAGKVAALLLDVLVTHQAPALVSNGSSGVSVMLRGRDHTSLASAYRLFSRAPGAVMVLAAAVRAHVVAVGYATVDARMAVVAVSGGGEDAGSSGGGGGAAAAAATATSGPAAKPVVAAAHGGGGGGGGGGGAKAVGAAAAAKEEAKDHHFVDQLLTLQEDMAEAVARDFGGTAPFARAVAEALTEVLNHPPRDGLVSNTEKVGAYVNLLLSAGGDRQLTKAGGRLTEDEREARLAALDRLVAQVTDKDVFERVCRDALADRLLKDRSVSNDAERSLVSKLKARYGTQYRYTGKMEGMLNDIAASSKMNDEYRAAAASAGLAHAVEFVPRVLTMGSWPTYPPHVFVARLPVEMAASMDAFTAYYLKHGIAHRTLTWPLSGVGKVAVVFTNDRGVKYELTAIPLQAAVLMHFNDVAGTAPLAAVRAAVGLTELVANRILHSLACVGKERVLTKTGAPTTVVDGDAFGVAGGFSSKALKVTLPSPPLEERASTESAIQERSHVLDACIVRIMKARKTLGHTELMAEVLAQLRFFHPDPVLIKKRIDNLIDRDYLKRDEDNPAVYNYVA